MNYDELEVPHIWMNGELINWDDAQVHVLSNVATTGAGVFEGTRCYRTDDGLAIFRLDAHLERMVDSASIIGIESEYSIEELRNATIELIQSNDFEDADGTIYLRHSASFGYESLGIDPTHAPVDYVIASFPFGHWMGEDMLERGAKVTFSPWRRLHSSQFPVQAKAVGIYTISMLSRQFAKANGYDAAILLDIAGNVSEGAGANLFIVNNGKLFTPGLDSSILPGITRRTIIQIARDLGFNVTEKTITVGELLTADEAFFCGTGAEVLPIRKINTTPIGRGTRGDVTKEIQETYFDVVTGNIEQYSDWLTPVDQ